MRSLLVVLLVVMTGCSQQVPPSATALTDADKSEIAQEVKEQSEGLGEFFGDYDFSRVESIFVDEGASQFLTGRAVAWSAEEMAQNLKRMSDYHLSNNRKGEHEDIRQDITVISENSALEILVFTHDVFEADNTLYSALEGTRTILWQKGDTGWQIKHVHVSYKNPDNDES